MDAITGWATAAPFHDAFADMVSGGMTAVDDDAENDDGGDQKIRSEFTLRYLLSASSLITPWTARGFRQQRESLKAPKPPLGLPLPKCGMLLSTHFRKIQHRVKKKKCAFGNVDPSDIAHTHTQTQTCIFTYIQAARSSKVQNQCHTQCQPRMYWS